MSKDRWSRQCTGESHSSAISQEEAELHYEKTKIAKAVMDKLVSSEKQSDFDKADGSDGLEPPSAEVPEEHFKRRALANEVLAATDNYILENIAPADIPGASPARRKSCIALGYVGEEAYSTLPSPRPWNMRSRSAACS
jgi:hypothetical protein